MRDFFHHHDLVYNIFTVTTPWQTAPVFLIMQVEILAAVVHEQIGNTVVNHRKFKFIRLDGAGGFRTVSRLDQLPFIRLE